MNRTGSFFFSPNKFMTYSALSKRLQLSELRGHDVPNTSLQRLISTGKMVIAKVHVCAAPFAEKGSVRLGGSVKHFRCYFPPWRATGWLVYLVFDPYLYDLVHCQAHLGLSFPS